MPIRLAATRSIFVSIGCAALLTGCAMTPVGPTVQAMPGRGKSAEQFQSEVSSCMQYSARQVKGQVDNANNVAVAVTLLGGNIDPETGEAVPVIAATEQGSIQVQYNLAFAGCMIAYGDNVPGYGRPSRVRSASHAAPRRVTTTHSESVTTSAPASAPASGWVAPTTSSSVTPAAATSSNWVAPKPQ
jgi:hypothetical protein